MDEGLSGDDDGMEGDERRRDERNRCDDEGNSKSAMRDGMRDTRRPWRELELHEGNLSPMKETQRR